MTHTAEKDVHDALCERQHTLNGFIRCLCSLRRAKAEAWDFGYACGLGDYSKSDDETRAANPYRTEAQR